MMEESGDGFVDRRKFARANIHAIARYTCPHSGYAMEIQTLISDISEGGLLMMAPLKGLRVHDSIQISFVMPGRKGQFATVWGKILYARFLGEDSYQAGVEFLNLSDEYRLAIREYVASIPKR